MSTLFTDTWHYNMTGNFVQDSGLNPEPVANPDQFCVQDSLILNHLES